MTDPDGERWPDWPSQPPPYPGHPVQPPSPPYPGFPPPPHPGHPVQPPPYPGFPPPPHPGYPGHPGFPPPRRRLALRLVVLCAVLALLCGTPAVWAFLRYAPTLLPPALAPTGSASASPTPSGPRSPQPGDPPSVRAAWVRAQIDAALEAQAAALLRGDEPGFLAVADAADAAVRTELTRRFRSLRAMQVTRWDPRVASPPDQQAGAGGRAEWLARLALRHCFVVPTCTENDIRVDSRWIERHGRAYLVGLEASGENQNGPRPWEVADLAVSVGGRAVVVTTGQYASRLSALLREADGAAAIADRFAVGAPPERYFVFFAGKAEWKQWYSGDRPDWAAGYAVPISATGIDVVLNAAETPSNFVDDIMRHELSHAASLRGARDQGAATWWLIEGMAEHAEMSGRGASQHDAVASGAVRRFIRSGKWDGTVTVAEPPAGAALQEAGARYGIAFLVVRRLAERYGEAKVLAFFEAVVHDGKSTDAASQEAFGAQWSVVQADCVSYVRRIAG